MSWREDLKRFNGPYYRWALENRRKFLTTELATEKALAKELEGLVEDLSMSIEKMPLDVGAQMKYVREGLKDFAKALNGKQKDIISKGIEKAVGIGVEYNEKVSADLLLKVFPEVAGKIQNVFGSVQEDVIKAMWNRRVGGLYLSDRIWNITGDTTEAIGRILTAGIAENMDPVDIARALTKYVKEGSGTLVKDYPNMMKRMGRRLPKDLNYESLRLVRTELSAAHGDATLKSATYNPACRGVKWVLSSEHPEYDICDELAYADQGFGPGVYRVEDAPPMPAHPNCLCFFTEVVEDPNAFVQRLERFRDNPDSDPELQEYWQRTFAKPSEEEETTPSFPSVPKKTLERAMHDPDYLSQQLNASHGDIVLQDMAKEVGFDKKPTLLSKEEMDAYIQQGNRELLRGIAGREGKAEKYVEQFKTGEYFAGKGVYGNGTYTAYGEDRMEVAKQFADGVEKNILRMALKKDAKIISYDALIEMQKAEFTALQEEERALRRKAWREADRIYHETGDDDKAEMFLKEAAKKWEEMEKFRRVLADPGRYALYKGYDAIDIPSPGFMLVLNRGKVFVQK